MSLKKFKKAYNNSNIEALRKFISYPKVLSTDSFMTYVEKSFCTNRDTYDVLVLILFNKYDLTECIANIIETDNTDLLENILSKDINVELDEKLILRTAIKGRVSMAKAIHGYINGVTDSYIVITNLLSDYRFAYNKSENSIDSFVMALAKENYKHANRIIPYINPNFWDDFAIKYAVKKKSLSVVKNLLLHNMVDPSADDELSLRIAIENESYDIANELLKHPLVRVNKINEEFIEELVYNNWLCVAEKIFNYRNDNVMAFFKDSNIDNQLVFSCNDITFLAAKMGITNSKDPFYKYWCTRSHENRQYLRDYKLNKPYQNKPYALQLDPLQICKLAFKHNDIDLAKSITNYPISINSNELLKYLVKYDIDISDDDTNESVCEYIWNNILERYDPNDLINNSRSRGIETIDKILNIINNDPRLNYKRVYDTCQRFQYVKRCNNRYVKTIMWQKLKDTYSINQYRIFLEEETGVYLDDLSELEQIFRDNCLW